LVVGAVIGATVGIVAQNILYPAAERQWRERRRRNYYRNANAEWLRFEQLHPRLVLVQAGWDQEGCFAEGSVVLRLVGTFAPGKLVRNYRNAHAAVWKSENYTNGEQVGISAISITRISDDPRAELRGRAHILSISVHRYQFFDFLATHMLRLRGTEEERAALDAIAGDYGPDQPVRGFPTPLSVGLSVLCEGGSYLLLPRRSAHSGAGGYWEAGKIFNAVGENAALRDFAAANREAHESTPYVIAKRGLYEELGFRNEDIQEAGLRLHSFAWASDLLDFKFFGYVVTSLSRSEVQERWRNAPDRSEVAGFELSFWPVESSDDSKALLTTIKDDRTNWSPEAVFCTVRSLLTLRRISIGDLTTEDSV
jgi:hypothetical protein